MSARQRRKRADPALTLPQSARGMRGVEDGDFRMKTVGAVVLASGMLLGASAGQAADTSYVRVMSCKGPDAAMELYVPEGVLTGAIPSKPLINGLYALDLSGALKGKHLEHVHIREGADHKSIVVDQYTRGLPLTTIPMAGGTVNFDNRFGTNAKCEKYSSQ